jgi:hypothetical protein
VIIQFSPHIVSGVAIYKNAIQNPSNIIGTIESLVSSDQGSRNKWSRAAVVSENGLSEVAESRTNMVTYLGGYPTSSDENSPSSQLNRINDELHLIFSQCVKHYADQFCFNIQPDSSPNYAILKYSLGEEYVHHADHSDRTPRTVSAVGYLNEGYVGGELDFDKLCFRYEPKAGDIVVFNSDEPYSHASLPISNGIKYSVVNWW